MIHKKTNLSKGSVAILVVSLIAVGLVSIFAYKAKKNITVDSFSQQAQVLQSSVPVNSENPIIVKVITKSTTFKTWKDVLSDPIIFEVKAQNTSDESKTLTFPGACAIRYQIGEAMSPIDTSCQSKAFTVVIPQRSEKSVIVTFDPKTYALKTGIYTIKVSVIGYAEGVSKAIIVGTNPLNADTTKLLVPQASVQTPVTPPAQSPVTPPVQTPVTPPAQSPVTPPVQTPVTPPVVPAPINTGGGNLDQPVTVTAPNINATLTYLPTSDIYAISAPITGKVVLQNNSNSQLKLKFTSGCQISSVLNKKKQNNPCTMNLTQVTVPANGTYTWDFQGPGEKVAGTYDGKVSVIGYDLNVSFKYTVGTKDSGVIVVTPPISNPEPEPAPAPKPLPVPTGMIDVESKADYTQLAKDMLVYAESAKTEHDKNVFLALSMAADETVRDTPFDAWGKTDGSAPAKVSILVQDASPTYAKSSSMIANIFNAIKRLFIAKVSSKPDLVFGGMLVVNNKCTRYYSVGNAYADSKEIKTAIFGKKPFFKGIFAGTSGKGKSTKDFPDGICAVLSTFDNLHSFDVAAAPSDSAYKSNFSYDNTRYYEEIGSDGKKYAKMSTLDNITERTLTNKGEFLETDSATAHTVYNEYGPAKFTCSYLWLDKAEAYSQLGSLLNSCNVTATLDLPEHNESIISSTASEKTNKYTVVTRNAFEQGDYESENQKRFKPLLDRPKNTYSFSTIGKTGVLLNSLNLSYGNDPFYTKYVQNNKRVDTLGAIVCQDTSDVIRATPNSSRLMAEYAINLEYAEKWKALATTAITRELAQAVAKGFQSQKEAQQTLKNELDPMVACKPTENIKEKIATYVQEERAWIKKWNQAAYDGRGIVSSRNVSNLKNNEYYKRQSNIDDAVNGMENCLKVSAPGIYDGAPENKTLVQAEALKEQKIDSLHDDPQKRDMCELLK